MKKPFYDKLEDIPQIDRDENNYQQVTTGPNAGKYVLLIDGTHPVMVKNTELLAKESQREIEKQQAVAAAVAPKDTEIARLTNELQQEKAKTGLPAGQVAVTLEDHQLLQQVKQLGEFKDIKAKVEEYATLKEQADASSRKTLFSEAAQAHGLNPDAFSALAEQQKLHEKLEMREVPDPKDTTKKVKHYFVKGKDLEGKDTSTVLGEFIESDAIFKPFVASLKASQQSGNTRRVPEQGVGNPPKDQSAAKSYVNSRYKRPAAKAQGSE